jgi:hypothetical protein
MPRCDALRPGFVVPAGGCEVTEEENGKNTPVLFRQGQENSLFSTAPILLFNGFWGLVTRE